MQESVLRLLTTQFRLRGCVPDAAFEAESRFDCPFEATPFCMFFVEERGVFIVSLPDVSLAAEKAGAAEPDAEPAGGSFAGDSARPAAELCAG